MDRYSIKSQRSLSRSKTSSHLWRFERLKNRSKSKLKTREGRTKYGGRRSEHKEASSDSNCGEDSEDTCKDLSITYKRPKPTPFTTRISRFRYHQKAKLSRNIKVYEGNKDLEDHLGIFLAAAGKEEWLISSWKNSHNKRGMLRIHRKSMVSKEVFMHNHGHPELVKKLNDKIPNIMDEMFERLRAFIIGEVMTGSVEVARAPQWDKGNAYVGFFGGQERIRGRSGPREF
ncbi:hypothetical protein Tco_0819070 [Tanacetum coccineum]|uniref:Reverse transcriptase domain-containing protein n=1 Tax=Tanacetum coccineum TaxID=301880 RepID=A0ABQ5A9U2_9ASTR